MTGLNGQRVYLDWNATALLRTEARTAMLEAMDVVGNPSSVHAEGRAAKAIVEKARGQIAGLIGCAVEELVFTSGATEAAALALAGRGRFSSMNYPSPIEHDCVFAWHNCTDNHSGGPGLLDDWHVSQHGQVESSFGEGITDLLIDGRGQLSISSANPETGVVQNVDHFRPEAHRTFEGKAAEFELFVDAVQSIGKVPFTFSNVGAAYSIASAHKIGGPKGIGALITKSTKELAQPVPGGGQEKGRRSGTENVIGIAGFGAAAEAARRDLQAGVWEPIENLRDSLEQRLADAAPDTIFFGKDAPRLPNTSCFAVPGWAGETQVMQMDLAGFAISAGSACSSGKVKKASRVLLAMGFDEVTASSAIRVSMGPTTTEAEVMAFADSWIAAYQRMKARAA